MKTKQTSRSRRTFIKRVSLSTAAAIISSDLNLLVTNEPNNVHAASAPMTNLPFNPAPVDDWNFYHRRQTAADVIINAVDLILDSSVPSPTHNLSIYADTVSLTEAISVPGKNLLIHARKVICHDGASIDVTGTIASKNYSPDARTGSDGTDYGANGLKGDDGGPGGNAGNVQIIAETIQGRLTVIANGGKGGRGQGGGNGYPGRQGQGGHATLDTSALPGYFKGTVGGPGNQGGNAGPGGIGGIGGDAGVVEIQIVNWPMTMPSISALPGEGGDGGKHGAPGDGGPGGPGGAHVYCSGASITSCHAVGSADGGPTGPKGNSVIQMGKNGPDPLAAGGAPGKSKYVVLDCKQIADRTYCSIAKTDYQSAIAKIDWSQSGATASISQLMMVLHKLELDYLSDDYGNATDYLVWIERLTRTGAGTLTPSGDLPSSPSPTLVTASSNEWSALRTRILVLLNQMNAGLDFYGLPRNYVPLVAYSFYKDSIEALISIAKDVEASYSSYRQKEGDINAQLAALDESIQSARNSIITLQTQIQNNEIAKRDLQDTIVELLLSITSQEQVLQATDAAFQSAVALRHAHEGGGCDFLDTFKTLFSIVSLAAPQFGAAKAIINVLDGKMDDKLEEALAKEGSGLPLFIQKIKVIDSNVKNIGKAYKEIEGLLPKHADTAKIAVTMENFEKTLKPYMDMAEAQKYLQQMRVYVDTIKTRNQKVLDYNSLLHKQASLEAEIVHRREETNRIIAIRAATKDPALVECKTFMGKLLTQTKSSLIRALYQERRAFEYWSLEDTVFPVADQNVVQLATLHGALLSGELEKRDQRNRPSQEYKGVKIVISETELPGAFKIFRDKKSPGFGKITFRIPFNHEQFDNGWGAITVRQVKIEIPNVKTSNNRVNIRLMHSGLSLFRKPNKDFKEFTHAPRFTGYTYSLDGTGPTTPIDNNLGGKEGEYAYLSPFAVWTLQLDPTVNPDLDLKKVKAFSLEFDGFFLPFTT